MSSRAVLLVNLGSPDSPSVPDVRRYLREFLMDERVLDAPYPIRWWIVNVMILPSRPAQSAEAYHKIWTAEGSPLVATSQKVAAQLRERLSIPVELAMRYQNPSIQDAVQKLSRQGVTELFLIPLFPHYAMSSYETAVERVREIAAKTAPGMKLSVMEPYYDRPDYIQAMVDNAAEHLRADYDHLLFSFHGIPERHLRKSDPTGSHCLSSKTCCAADCKTLATCYRAQCYRTAEAFARAASLPQHRYSVAFQSRLGRQPWLTPYADRVIEGLPKVGVKRLLVICPSFVSDCLETLEEIGLRGQETFRESGGEELKLVPCLNTHPQWIRALENMTKAWMDGAIGKNQSALVASNT
jgi:ferrochelatase